MFRNNNISLFSMIKQVVVKSNTATELQIEMQKKKCIEFMSPVMMAEEKNLPVGEMQGNKVEYQTALQYSLNRYEITCIHAASVYMWWFSWVSVWKEKKGLVCWLTWKAINGGVKLNMCEVVPPKWAVDALVDAYTKLQTRIEEEEKLTFLISAFVYTYTIIIRGE